ncbi:short-chain dehydrogenase/reductase SDR, partial [mine drainage metagenome]
KGEKKHEKSGMRILITGGTSGLGKAAIEVFLFRGWSVATFGRRNTLISELRNKYRDYPFIGEVCDMRVANHVDSFLEQVKESFGGLDVIALNAGELGKSPLKSVGELELEDFRTVFETNLFGNVSLIQKILRNFQENKIVFSHVTSDAGSNPYANWGPYGSSKASMDFLMKIMEVENQGTGKQFVSFDPGNMNTEMHHLALPEDDPVKLKNPVQSADELYMQVMELI